MTTSNTRNRAAFAAMGFDADQSNALCLQELWVRRGLIGGANDGQPAALEGMRTWTVRPYRTGGYHVLCDGQAVNWFPGYERAFNEAYSRNCAEELRLQYQREGRGS